METKCAKIYIRKHNIARARVQKTVTSSDFEWGAIDLKVCQRHQPFFTMTSFNPLNLTLRESFQVVATKSKFWLVDAKRKLSVLNQKLLKKIVYKFNSSLGGQANYPVSSHITKSLSLMDRQHFKYRLAKFNIVVINFPVNTNCLLCWQTPNEARTICNFLVHFCVD